MSPGELIIYRKIMEITANIKVLQQSMIEIHTDGRNLSAKTTTVKQANEEQVKLIGLPLQSEESLKQFDIKLNDMNFYNKVVS